MSCMDVVQHMGHKQRKKLDDAAVSCTYVALTTGERQLPDARGSPGWTDSTGGAVGGVRR